MASTLERLRKTVEEGNYYEAQQLIKTLYFRYYSQKKYGAAKDILINGAFTMLNAKQTTCAAELIQTLLKLFVESNVKVEAQLLETIIQLAALIPSEDPIKVTVLTSALKWSTSSELYKQGYPGLHAHLAKTYSQTGEYMLAQRHYMKTNQPEDFGLMVAEWASHGLSSERDLYITRSILMYLTCVPNIHDAKTIFKAFTSKVSQPTTPLLNFLRLLLLTLESKTYRVFDILCQKYETALSRDPTFNQYLDRIAQTFYAVKPVNSNAGGAPGFGNLINDLFKNFMSNDIELGAEDVD